MRRNTAAGREMRRAEEDGRRSRGRHRPETEPPKRLGADELVLPDVALHPASAPLRRGRAREFEAKREPAGVRASGVEIVLGLYCFSLSLFHIYILVPTSSMLSHLTP
jgi:hypothetical protein